MPIIITGFHPYRSAMIPQKIEAIALPTINEDPSRNKDLLASQCEKSEKFIDDLSQLSCLICDA